MKQLHFTCSIVTTLVMIVHSSHQQSAKDENDLKKFYSNVLQKLDEIKESSSSFQKTFKESSDAMQQLKQRQTETEQALNKVIQAIHLLTDYSSSKMNLGELLTSAVKNSDTKQVKLLLEIGAPVEYQDSEKNRPIHVAALNRQPQILEALLENKADINSKGAYDQTALIKSGSSNCVECARILLDKGADMGILDGWDNTAIIHPARVGYKEFVELLLSKGADINDAQRDGLTGLHWAARDGQLPIVQYLIEKGANVKLKNVAGQTPFDEAVANNHPLVADYLRSI